MPPQTEGNAVPPKREKSFKTMLRLRRIEWVPIIAACLLNVVMGIYVVRNIRQQMDAMFEDQKPLAVELQEVQKARKAGRSVPSPDRLGSVFKGSFGILEVGKYASAGLMALGVGCWLRRLNQWIKED